MMRFLTISLLAASLVLAGLGEAGAAASYNRYEIHPGSSCVRYAGAQSSLNDSGIGNADPTYNLYVDCPIVKSWHSYYGDTFLGVSVRVLDSHVSKGVSCSLHAVERNDYDGRVFHWRSAQQTSVGYGSLPRTLSFGTLGNNSEHLYLHSHLYLSCVIPDSDVGRSYIESYTVTEAGY